MTFLLALSKIYAQDYNGGSDIFRIGYTNSRTISNSSDVITLGLVSVDLTKKSGLFKQDSQAGVLVKATISGYDINTRLNQSTTIERLYLVDVTKYPNGQVSLPIEGTLFDNFKLSFENNVYTKVELDVFLLKERKDSDFSFVLKNVSKLTQDLPFPTNPFDPIVKTFTSTMSDMLNPANDAENNIKERVPTGKISLNFLPNSPFATKTGIFAIIFGTEPPLTQGYIDIKKQDNYNLSIETEPKRVIMVADKNKPQETSELKNDNLMFYVTAYSSNTLSSKDVSTSLTKASYKYTVSAEEIQNSFAGSDWYAITKTEFQDDLQYALEKFSDKKSVPFIKNNQKNNKLFEINSTKLLITDYINAIEIKKKLGLNTANLNLAIPNEDVLIKQ